MSRNNPSFPAPPDPYHEEDLREFFLFSENDEPLARAHDAIAARLANKGIAGKLTQEEVRAAWTPYVGRVIRQYRREIGNVDRFEPSTPKHAIDWLTQWTEHELYGRGLAHMMKIAASGRLGDD